MTRVAIIGGGIGGLTAANALSRAGIEVVPARVGETTSMGHCCCVDSNDAPSM